MRIAVHFLAASVGTALLVLLIWEVMTTGTVTFEAHPTKTADARQTIFFLSIFGLWSASSLIAIFDLVRDQQP